MIVPLLCLEINVISFCLKIYLHCSTQHTHGYVVWICKCDYGSDLVIWNLLCGNCLKKKSDLRNKSDLPCCLRKQLSRIFKQFNAWIGFHLSQTNNINAIHKCKEFPL